MTNNEPKLEARVVDTPVAAITMQHAFATAKPLAMSAIRRVSYSTANPALMFYFADNKLVGRRFICEVREHILVLREDVDKGPLVRQTGNSNSYSVQITKGITDKLYEMAWIIQNLNIKPEVEHGRLVYRVPTSLPARLGGDTSKPSVAAPVLSQPLEHVAAAALSATADESRVREALRMPRVASLRQMLADLRQLERETPYRLERADDGTLQFVARIS